LRAVTVLGSLRLHALILSDLVHRLLLLLLLLLRVRERTW
jgi:hypothetical protein